MNITDFNPKEALDEARETYGEDCGPVELIFCRQLQLMESYLPLEDEILGIKLSTDIMIANINHSKDQFLLKARAWWMTEELCEALDALYSGNNIKFTEELVDALHFQIELCILSGLGPLDIEPARASRIFGEYDPTKVMYPSDYLSLVEMAILEIIRSIGMTMWQLRNKPWKLTQVPTDKPNYERRLIRTTQLLINLIEHVLQGEIEDVTAVYLQKSLVNQFRIRSHY